MTTIAKKRYNTISDRQRKACIYKVEDGLKNADIARRLSVSPQAVGKWFKTAHVRRELARQAERYSVDVLPELVKQYKEIRDITVSKLRASLEGTVTIKEANQTIATVTAALENELSKLEEARVASEDRETVDSITKILAPEELDALARRIGGMSGSDKLRLCKPSPKIIEAIQIEE